MRGAEREFGADAHGDAGRSNRRQRRSNQRQRPSYVPRSRLQIASRSFRHRAAERAPASAPAALRPPHLKETVETLFFEGGVASAMGPVFHRIWEGRKPSLVWFGNAQPSPRTGFAKGPQLTRALSVRRALRRLIASRPCRVVGYGRRHDLFSLTSRPSPRLELRSLG